MSTSTLLRATPWIISRRDDLVWFIGSALVAYLFLSITIIGGQPPTKLIVLWALTLDSPPVYSTFTRVLLAKGERRRIGKLWLAIIPLCIIGPFLVVTFGFQLFYLLVVTWGHYHISKQHMGFVFIYKRKLRETDDFKLDKWFTLVSLALPFLYFASVALLHTKVLLPLFLCTWFFLAAYYAWHQTRKTSPNIPKLLLLAAFIPLTWLGYLYAANDPSSPSRLLTAVIVTNIGHSFQYLRLVWFHNRNRYSKNNGLLGLISRKWIYFFAAACILAVPSHLAQQYGSIAVSSILGFLLFHYIVDSKIWRVRGDAELAKALRL